LEKVKSSSLGYGSHDTKASPMYNQYSPPSSHHGHGGSPLPGYTPQMAAQLYAPPVRYGSPPPMTMQQHPYMQRHPSYMSATSSAESGGQVPGDIRRQYSTA
jgi:hypothetical protein